MKVYLDDERQTPEGWIRVYTVQECLVLLQTRKCTHVSFDNDLGENQPQGFKALDALEEMVYEDPTFPVPIITVHSSNPARVQSMQQTAIKLEVIRQQQNNGDDS